MGTIRNNVAILLTAAITACSNGGDGNSIEATGTIEATNVVISSKNAGEILTILKEEGEKVDAGDTILIIDNETLGYQLEQAQASVQIAEAQLALMIKGAREEDIKQSEEMLKQSETNFTLAKNDFERFTKLWETKAITQKQYEEITARYNISLAQFSAAKENYHKVKKIFRPEEIEQSKANVKKAKATASLINKNIRDSYIISPIDGFVVKKFVEVGETVSPMSSLVKVSNLSEVELIIYVSELELGKVKLGQKTEVTVDSFPEKNFKGRVIYISPEAEFTPKNIQTKDERTKLVFAVKIAVDNKDFELKPGMPADAKVFLQ